MRRMRRYTLDDILDELRKADIPDLTRRLLLYSANEHKNSNPHDLVTRAFREAIHGEYTPLFRGRLFDFLVSVIERIA